MERIFPFDFLDSVPESVPRFHDHKVIGKYSFEKDGEKLAYSDGWSDDDIRIRPDCLASLCDINFSEVIAKTEGNVTLPKRKRNANSTKGYFKWMSSNRSDVKSDDGSPVWIIKASFLSTLLDTAWDKMRKFDFFIARRDNQFVIAEQTPRARKKSIAAKMEKAYFKNSLTGQEGHESSLKRCKVIKTNFGEKVMVVFDTIDAVDENGRQINALLRKPQTNEAVIYHSFSLRKLWRDAQVTGAKRAIVATTSKDRKVASYEDINISSIPEKVQNFKASGDANYTPWQPSRCFYFWAELLKFLEDEIKPGRVYAVKKESGKSHLALTSLEADLSPEDFFLQLEDASAFK